MPAALFGYYESTGERAATAAILTAVKDWVRRPHPALSLAIYDPDHGAANPTEVVLKTAGVRSTVRRAGLAWAIGGETAERAADAGITKLIMGPDARGQPQPVRRPVRLAPAARLGLFAADL